MSDKEKKFQIKLWISALFSTIIVFVVMKYIWRSIGDWWLLVLLMVSFVINYIISAIYTRK